MSDGIKARIESELEVKAYIQDLKFALNNGAKIDFQVKRRVDDNRDEKYTNQYTVNALSICRQLKIFVFQKEVKCVSSVRSIMAKMTYI